MTGADRATAASEEHSGSREGFAGEGPPGPAQDGQARAGWAVWLGLAAILALTAIVRWRLLDVPLERDEGEYAYAARLLLRGIAPYDHVYSMKPPGIYVAYAAVLAVFGETQRSVHLGLLLINAITTGLTFALGRRMLGAAGGLAAAAAFAALSLGVGVQGMFANAEHFVVLFTTAGMLLLLRAVGSGGRVSLLAAGLSFGIAITMKQHGAFLAAAALVYLIARTPRDRPSELVRTCVLFASAVAAPYLIGGVLLWLAGVLDTAWLWTVRYAFAYTGQIPLADLPARLVTKSMRVMGPAMLLWAMAGAGLVGLIAWRPRPLDRLFVLLFAAGASLAVLPGLYLRPHYYVLLLPIASLLVAVGACALSDRLAGPPARRGLRLALVGGIVGLAVAHTAWTQRQILFALPPEQVVRAIYPNNPFAESLRVAQYVAAHSADTDRLAIIGSEPQIYYYARRTAATGYVYTYPLGEAHPYAGAMQSEMIAEIESSDPAFVVWVRAASSWGPAHADAATQLLEWLPGYLSRYELVLAVDMGSRGSRYTEGPDLARRGERARDSIEVYRRRGGPE